MFGVPFKSKQAHELIEYVSMQYGRDLEYLWPKFTDNAIWRRADNEKWFGLLMVVNKNKIDHGGDASPVEILGMRCAPDMLDFIVDGKIVFPGWHMNKRHWITIILDGRMKTGQIKKLLDASFGIAGEK